MIRLISNERGDTALVEAYRTLRSNLQYVCNQQKCKPVSYTHLDVYKRQALKRTNANNKKKNKDRRELNAIRIK